MAISGSATSKGITVTITIPDATGYISLETGYQVSFHIQNAAESGYTVMSAGGCGFNLSSGSGSSFQLKNPQVDPGGSTTGQSILVTMRLYRANADDALSVGFYAMLILKNMATSQIEVINLKPATLSAIPVDSAKSNTPTISEFTARRCDVSGNPSDEGQYIRNVIKGSIAPGMGWTAAQHTLRVGYRLQGSTGAYTWVNKTGFAASINIDEKLNTGAVFAPGSVYEIRCELTNNQRSITAYSTSILPKAFANFHLAGSGFGVGVGQYATGTEANPKFECQYPAYLHGGIKTLGGDGIAGLGVQEGKIQELGSVASGAYSSHNVDFPIPFAAGTVPTVVVGFRSESTAGTFGRCCLSTLNETNTGFTARFFNGDSAARNPGLRWIAVGVPAGG